MTTLEKPETLLNIPAVAARLDVSVPTVRRLIRRGDLPALRVGGQLRIDPHELEAWLYSDVGGESTPLDPPRGGGLATTPPTSPAERLTGTSTEAVEPGGARGDGGGL